MECNAIIWWGLGCVDEGMRHFTNNATNELHCQSLGQEHLAIENSFCFKSGSKYETLLETHRTCNGAQLLDTTMHLYKRSRASAVPSVGRSICPLLFSNHEFGHSWEKTFIKWHHNQGYNEWRWHTPAVLVLLKFSPLRRKQRDCLLK